MARGKRQTVVTMAIAREMSAFLRAIGREVEPQPAALSATAGSASIKLGRRKALNLTILVAHRWRQGSGRGILEDNCVADIRRRPLTDRGSPGRRSWR